MFYLFETYFTSMRARAIYINIYRLRHAYATWDFISVFPQTLALSLCQKRPQTVKICPRAGNGTRLVHYFVDEMDPSSGK